MREQVKHDTSAVSTTKRDFGFVPLRRGLRDHLGLMTGNAVKLYIWLLIAAAWKRPLRGCVTASFEDIAGALMFSSKTLQRACDELERGQHPFIAVQRAANQYELTRIRILRYDSAEFDSGVDKSDHSRPDAPDSAVETAMDSGVDKYDQSTVHRNTPKLHELGNLRAPKNLEEVKKGRAHARQEEKKGESDAVRRPIDAELQPSTSNHKRPSAFVNSKPKASLETETNFIAPGKAKLQSRIAVQITKRKESYAQWVDYKLSKGEPHPFGDKEKRAFAELGYKIDIQSAEVSFDFVDTATDVCEKYRGKGISGGNLCSKVIDALVKEQDGDIRNGGDGGGYYWPPDFQKHRDKLRMSERALAKAGQLSKNEVQELVKRKEAEWVDDRRFRLTEEGIVRFGQTNSGNAA